MAEKDKKDLLSQAQNWISENSGLIKKFGVFSLVIFIALGFFSITLFGVFWMVVHWELNLLFDLNLGFPARAALSFLLSALIFLTVLFQILNGLLKKFSDTAAGIGKIMQALSSTFSVWILGALIPMVVHLLVKSFYIQPWMEALASFLLIVIFFWATDKAFEHVAPISSKKWGYAMIIMVFLVVFIVPVTASLRNDYYNTDTGKIKVSVTPSTGKLWRGKHPKHDPTTGEKIVEASKQQIKEYEKNRLRFSNLFGKTAPAQTQTVTVFLKTYSDSDIDPIDKNIKAFTWDSRFERGDIIEIIGKIPGSTVFNAKEIAYFRGKDFHEKWGTTSGGYASYMVENVPVGNYYRVWIEKDSGIEATIRVTRKIMLKPNISMLASI
jgi:hypothetical protein